jgi:signal transduction histidine kinase/ligand-binding sensor domain-containing protein/DNA-binding response OmpR family regulator
MGKNCKGQFVFGLLACFTILFLGNSIDLISQDNPASFKIFSTRNGLSQNDVKCILQDSSGFVWIGTHDGLNRFDGYDFKIYRKGVDPDNTITSNLVNSLVEDTYGNLFIGTDDEGVVMFNRSQNRFIPIRNTKENPDVITDNHVLELLGDRHGFIWIATTNGLNKLTFNYQTQAFQVVKLKANGQPFSLSDNYINALHQDHLGNLWVGTAKGLNRFIETSGSHQFIQYDSGPRDLIRDICGNDSALVLSSSNLYALPFKEINKSNPVFSVIYPGSFHKILISKKKEIWATSLKGINVLSRSTGGQLRNVGYQNNPSEPGSLSKNITTTIMEDASGVIWIGTNGGGVNLFNPERKKFRHYKKSSDKGSLSYDKIRSVYEDADYNLWMGTEGGGLNWLRAGDYNYATGFKHFNLSEQNGGENFVFAIEQVAGGKLLVGSGFPLNVESIRFMKGSNRISKAETGLVVKNRVFAILKDRKGIVWIGTYLDGLYRVKLNEAGMPVAVDHFTKDTKSNSSISSNIIRSIAEDQEGNLWIGTDAGLNELSSDERMAADPTFVTYFYNRADTASLSHDYILPIFVSSAGEVWIGTMGGGLNRLIKGAAGQPARFERINSLHGLPSNVIKSILEDDNGNLWISSNKGLTNYHVKSKQIKNYGISDGLQDFEFSELAAFKRRNGDLIFGGVNGFNVFRPADIRTDSSPVKLAFTEFQLFNKKIGVGDSLNGRAILDQDIHYTQSLTLSYHENSFSLGFSAMDYLSPEKISYAYKLEGFDKDWMHTTADNRFAKYTNLAPGGYVLKVKASNSDGIWNEDYIQLAIAIYPPWWKTAWAFLMYCLLVILSLWFFRKYTLITSARKNELIFEHYEKEKIEEISQLKLRFFTNISHEFRTPLTLILGFVEKLKNERFVKAEDQQRYYYYIHRNSHVLLNLVNQLLDFRKVEQGKMVLKVSFGDLAQYINALCENFYELASRKKIDFVFVGDGEARCWYDPEIMERIVFNLLSNAFKFTPENGEIQVALQHTDDMTILTVTDTGSGISKEVQDHLFDRFVNSNQKGSGTGIGLSLTKNLIELHRGKIVFQSKENGGTTFTVHLPSKKESYEKNSVTNESSILPSPKEDVNWLVTDTAKFSTAGITQTGKEQTLLLVEDNKEILFFLAEHFNHTYNIDTAYEGSEALDICLKKNIDLVVSDILMPGMNGFEFCEKLKTDDRINHIPIVLLTAKNSSEHKLKGYSLGADAYMAKPFDLTELESIIQSLIANRKAILSKLRKNIDVSPSDVALTSQDERFLKRIVSFIEQHISNSELTVDMLSRECGMSLLHLNKKLRVLTDHTANSFIRNIRLKRAAQLMRKNQYSVSDVMYEVGFTDPKYFRTCFKKEFDLTPSDYQREQSESEVGKIKMQE